MNRKTFLTTICSLFTAPFIGKSKEKKLKLFANGKEITCLNSTELPISDVCVTEKVEPTVIQYDPEYNGMPNAVLPKLGDVQWKYNEFTGKWEKYVCTVTDTCTWDEAEGFKHDIKTLYQKD